MAVAFCVAGCLAAADFQAGVARVDITPDRAMPISGYVHGQMSEGVEHRLWAKALALADRPGKPSVIVTLDLSTVPGDLADELAGKVQAKYGLQRDRLLLNCSHTHGGPVVEGAEAVGLPDEVVLAVKQYREHLLESLTELTGAALHDLSHAKLSFAEGEADFAVNRRVRTAQGYGLGVNPDGPVDHSVPVLKISEPDGRIRAILFGYACQNTAVGARFFKLHGDYAGFTQLDIEKDHPGTVALFLELCAGDQNPYPRNSLEIAQRHGAELASAVEHALAGELKPVRPPLESALEVTQLQRAPLPRDAFEKQLHAANPARAGQARRMVALNDAGRVPRQISYPVQVVRFGTSLTLIALGGQPVVDYALRARREAKGDVIVAGYSNDVRCYLPSLRVLKEGGFEVLGSMLNSGLPGPFDESVEETVWAAVHHALSSATGHLHATRAH